MCKIISLLILTVLLVGCSKAPDHVISEGDMTDLMVDMYKAEAIIDHNEGLYHTDSIKLAFRQSILMRHNLTQEQLDTSLIWYAHNLDVYNEVQKDIIERLEDEYKELAKGDFTSVAVAVDGDMKPSVPRYRAVGDTADIWGRSRTWMLLPGFVDNLITFDMKPDKENMVGDKYELAFKLCNMRNTLKVYMGVDYKDGATAFVYRTITGDGWNRCVLQSDSLREVRRIYAYMTYMSQPKQIICVDSVELLRTHLDRKGYESAMKLQKTIETKKPVDNEKQEKDSLKTETGGDKEKAAKTSPRTKRLKDIKKIDKQELSSQKQAVK